MAHGGSGRYIAERDLSWRRGKALELRHALVQAPTAMADARLYRKGNVPGKQAVVTWRPCGADRRTGHGLAVGGGVTIAIRARRNIEAALDLIDRHRPSGDPVEAAGVGFTVGGDNWF